MQTCEWFNDTAKNIQKKISSCDDFKCVKTPKNYIGVVSDLKKSTNKYNLNLFTDKPVATENFISSHRYLLHFNKEQHEILKNYFSECKRVYDLCVDIWTDYKKCTSTWMLLKDVIFEFLYRNPKTKILPIEEIKMLIIDELKKKQEEFNLENVSNQEKIKELKQKATEKHKQEMKEYNKKVQENKKKHIKTILIKPKKEKIKIEKIKKPRKPKGEMIKKPAPDEMLKSEIKIFCTNLSNARNQAFENKKYGDDAFEMKHKNVKIIQTVSIDSRGLSKNGIFIRTLGNLKCENWEKIVQKYDLKKECKLQYDAILNKYYIYVIFETEEIQTKKRNEVVALDPGEKIFNYFYSNEMCGKLGNEMRNPILKLRNKISKYESILKKKINKNGIKKKETDEKETDEKETNENKTNDNKTNENKTNKKRTKLKNRKQIKNKIRKLWKRIKGYVNEIHKKSAKFLCENYENILIPEFKTKPMLSKYKIEKGLEKINEIENKTERKKEKRNFKKQIRLSAKVKTVLNLQSHYKFKEYLKATAKRYRTNVYDVDEHYTSQCCTSCGVLSKVYDKNRTKECINCKLQIDRDLNGSRNIYIKCICSKIG